MGSRSIILESNRLYSQLLGAIVARIVEHTGVVICSRASEALRLMRVLPFAWALVGVDLPDMDGLDFIPEIINSKLSHHTVILTARSDRRTLSGLRHLSYDGLIDTSAGSVEEVCWALRGMAHGRRYTSSSLTAKILDSGSPGHVYLTIHEEAILSLLGEGIDDEDAAERLGLRPRTVETHRTRIMRKLNLHHKGQLIDYALANLYVRRSSEGILHPGFECILKEMQGAVSEP